MKYVYRQKFTKPMPANAVIKGSKVYWTDTNGKKQTAELTDGGRVRIQSEIWTARLTVNGKTVTRSTGCEKKANAEAVLREWQADAENVKSGLLKPEDIQAKLEAKKGLEKHLADFQTYMETKRRSTRHIAETVKHIKKMATTCAWKSLSDINRKDVEKQTELMTSRGLSANSVNHLMTALISFCRWAHKNGRLSSMPLVGLDKMTLSEDKRHIRRALTEADFLRLVEATKARPLHDALNHHRGQGEAKLSDSTRQSLIHEGETRAICYLILFYTGLRLSELKRLRVKSVDLNGSRPCLCLEARSTKSKRGDQIPLASRLTNPLACWIEGKKLDEFVVDVPDNLLKIFNKDLEHAGIPKADDQGRVLDLHALRMSLGTNLLMNGVPLLNVQKIMRHSTPTLTANLYTDISLLDLHGAMDSTFRDKGEAAEGANVKRKIGS
jgi:site-specific recombinase XerC